MRLAPDLSPKKLRGKPGAKAKFSLTDVLDNLRDGMTTKQWRDATYLNTAMVDSTFFKFKKLAVDEGLIEERSKKWFRKIEITPLEQANVDRLPRQRDKVALRAA